MNAFEVFEAVQMGIYGANVKSNVKVSLRSLVMYLRSVMNGIDSPRTIIDHKSNSERFTATIQCEGKFERCLKHLTKLIKKII
ncbi:CLUMA_CG013613, isoform A [Clunio marinus]|uniref:CLUMA_CG013613, isoform A n=1 Tax=Clunio marinus TaxID=568069 RepID=A0A1J1ILA4_9DIPT|nr:CLUMA_CG013613, isoform A [Clunio marinus]